MTQSMPSLGANNLIYYTLERCSGTLVPKESQSVPKCLVKYHNKMNSSQITINILYTYLKHILQSLTVHGFETQYILSVVDSEHVGQTTHSASREAVPEVTMRK